MQSNITQNMKNQKKHILKRNLIQSKPKRDYMLETSDKDFKVI